MNLLPSLVTPLNPVADLTFFLEVLRRCCNMKSKAAEGNAEEEEEEEEEEEDDDDDDEASPLSVVSS